MQTVLVTGTGGAGRTTVAAATALAAARRGRRTLLLSAEDPGALAALLGAEAGTEAEPRPVAPGLHAARIDSAAGFRERATALQEYARPVLDLLGAVPLHGDELAEPPGADALALLCVLGAVRRPDGGPRLPHGPPDAVVVDMPPLEQAVRTLALPEHLRRCLRRLLPPERRAARALRPVLGRLAGAPVPGEALYEAASRLERELAAAQQAVEAPGTAVRLVAEPGPAAARALRATRAGLALHGFAVDAVVANRLLPAASCDPWLAGLAARQRAALEELRGGRSGRDPAVVGLPHLGREPRGAGDLAGLADRLAAVPDPPAGARARHGGRPGTVEDLRGAEGVLLWRLPLPGASRASLTLVRRGDEVVVTTGPFRRVLPLPAALCRCTAVGARLADGELRVRFEPDPEQWPVRR